MPQTLNGWKEIASFLQSSVSSAHQLEREEGLPVHRTRGGRTGLVFCFPAEIQHWVRIRGALEKQRILRAKHRNLRVKFLNLRDQCYQRMCDQQKAMHSLLPKAAIRRQGADGAKRQGLVEEAIAGMSRKFVQGQEQERTRIARELHDDINQRMALLAIQLDQVQRQMGLSSEINDRLRELQKQTVDIANDIQALAHELHSSKLEYLGLVGAMKGCCKEFGERLGMEIEFVSELIPTSLPSEISLCLLRVLQEALHNAAKHSKAKRVEVELRRTADGVYLIVSDSGVGFDVRTAMRGQGLGLTSMQERVRLVNGTIVIKSKLAAGTSIHAYVPFRFSRESASAIKAGFSLDRGLQVIQ